jgi:hypothetical protein
MGFFKGKKSPFEELQEAVKKQAVLEINYQLSSGPSKNMKGVEDSSINQAVDAFLTSAFKLEKKALKETLEKLSHEKAEEVKKHLTEAVSLNVREDKKCCYFIGLSYKPPGIAKSASNKKGG